MRDARDLGGFLDDAMKRMRKGLEEARPDMHPREVGHVVSVGSGVARVAGLGSVGLDELVEFEGGQIGMAFDLHEEFTGVVFLSDDEGVDAGDEVRRTGRVASVPVGDAILGRVITPLGEPLDDGEAVRTDEYWPVERDATPIIHREPVVTPLATGLKVIDAIIPVGRGQRELILGDRSTGKTAIAVDAMYSQKDTGVICIYCAVGQRSSAVGKLVDDLKRSGSFDHVAVVVAEGESPPGLRYIAPFAATTMGEYFMDKGRDVLVIYDDLTSHAKSYREMALLMRRPPGREAYPGDIFFLHSRLLERSAKRREEFGGGSLTALPIAQTESGNVTAYIPTNLISITDGQIYLDPGLMQKGQIPAVDVGRSVSRVGGDAQLPAYRAVAGDLKLMYSQFLELEKFSRFSARLDEETRRKLERGARLREVLKQDRLSPLGPAEQLAVLVPLVQGVLDEVPRHRIRQAQERIIAAAEKEHDDVMEAVRGGKKLDDDAVSTLARSARNVVESMQDESGADDGES